MERNFPCDFNYDFPCDFGQLRGFFLSKKSLENSLNNSRYRDRLTTQLNINF